MGPIGGNFIIIAKEHYASLKAPSLSPTDNSATSKLGEATRRSVAIVSLLEEYGPPCAHSAGALMCACVWNVSGRV
ncbi:hypothetical protein EON64_05160 [archaeon]|nr:MAG: hypothetical protein EON64_05160 [archaeon]